MALQLSVLLRSTLFAWDELRRTFGPAKAGKVMLEIGRRNARGLPFQGLPPPSDAREAATRAELAVAVNLYQVLRERLDATQAFSVARRIILNSSLLHLRALYPDFGSSDFRHLTGGSTEEASSRLGADFAFADTKVLEITEAKASFDVVRCRIPEVLSKVDALALAPIFCEVDRLYFAIYEPAVELTRLHTQVAGDAVCDFRLSWKDASRPTS